MWSSYKSLKKYGFKRNSKYLFFQGPSEINSLIQIDDNINLNIYTYM